MSKYLIFAATLTALSACTPPPSVPPPRLRPDPQLAPKSIFKDNTSSDLASYLAPPQPAANQAAPTAGVYPTAERTADPDQVLSPYEPYNVIDVAGFKPGQLARDPSNQKIFRVP